MTKAPMKITDSVIADLHGPFACVFYGNATLRRNADRYVMSGGSGRHSLAVNQTDAARLDAHWQGFARHSLNA